LNFGERIRPAMVVRFVPKAARLVVPDVRCDLVLVNDRVMLAGPLTHARLSMQSPDPITVASFDPVTVRGWLKIPLDLITDRILPLADVAPKLAEPFAERLLTGSAAVLALPRMPEFQAERRLAIATARLKGGWTVRATAEAVELSERQLERIFQLELGLTPKLFARINRLRRGISEAKAGTGLADAAAIAGFADQSHFNRELRALLGGPLSVLGPNVGNLQDIRHGAMAD
jgi:AraC-like DNA-binding protein